MAEKILIVEDDERFRRALRSALADQGYGIEEAGSVSDAREVLKREAIQVILLDLNLPVQSGTVLLELIKNRADEYRVIILTAHDDRLSAEKAKSYSVYRYLTKTSHSFSESLRFEINSAFEDLEKSKKRIFLSYARENHTRVKRHYKRFLSEGFKPWMDMLDLQPGETWEVEINKAIVESSFFIAFLSSSWQEDRYMPKEIDIALTVKAAKSDNFVIAMNTSRSQPNASRYYSLCFIISNSS